MKEQEGRKLMDAVTKRLVGQGVEPSQARKIARETRERNESKGDNHLKRGSK